jgi:hypothetical protein
MIITELVARFIRDMLNEKLREVKSTDDKPYLEVACKFLSSIFKDNGLHLNHQQLQERYQGIEDAAHVLIDCITSLDDLFVRVQKLSGIKFKTSKFPLDVADMIKMAPVTCHLYLVYYCAAFVAHQKGVDAKDMKQLNKAESLYLKSWLRKPHDLATLINWGNLLREKAVLCNDKEKKKEYIDAAYAKFELVRRFLDVNDYNYAYNYGALLYDHALISSDISEKTRLLDKAMVKNDSTL